jgi:hypothetical protein
MLEHLASKSSVKASTPTSPKPRGKTSVARSATKVGQTKAKQTKKRPASPVKKGIARVTKAQKSRAEDVPMGIDDSKAVANTLNERSVSSYNTRPSYVDLTMSDGEDDIRPKVEERDTPLWDDDRPLRYRSTTVKRESDGNNGDSAQEKMARLQDELECCRAKLDVQSARAQQSDDEIARLKREHTVFEQKICSEKEVEEQRFKKLQGEMERELAGLRGEHSKIEQGFMIEKGRMATELRTIREECHELKMNLETSSKAAVSHQKECEDLRLQLRIEQQRVTTLEAENTSLKQELQQQKQAHADVTKQLDAATTALTANLETAKLTNNALSAKYEAVKAENEELKSANEALKSIRLPTASPIPTISQSSTSDLEQRSENVRKTYFRVKKKYDQIYSIARNIGIATRGMNLGNFGEFGMHLRQLKSAMEEGEEKEEAGTNREGDRVMKVDSD